MALAMLLAYIILITPVILCVTFHHDRVTDVNATIRLWNIPRRFHWRSHRDRDGRHIVRLPDKPGQKPRITTRSQEQQALIFLGTFLRSNHARRFLLHHLHLNHAQISLRIGLGNAAHTAALTGLIAGTLRTIARNMPGRIRSSVQPDFLIGRTRAHVRCILSFRLGTLFITAAMAFIALVLEKREHAPSKAEEAS